MFLITAICLMSAMIIDVSCDQYSVNDTHLKAIAETALERAKQSLMYQKLTMLNSEIIADNKIDRNMFMEEHHLVTALMEPGKTISQKAVISLAATHELLDMTNMTIGQLQADLAAVWSATLCDNPTMECAENTLYRTADGTCNNLKNVNWGASFTTQARYLSPVYDDGLESPRTKGFHGDYLKSARDISNIIFGGESDLEARHDNSLTVMVFAWGQFLDHDLTHTPTSEGGNEGILDCCGSQADISSECFPIQVPSDDKHFLYQKCIPFARSAPSFPEEGCVPGIRQQMNQVTAYIDASNIYGSSAQESLDLRTMDGGLLKTSPDELLPDGGFCGRNEDIHFCPKSGDRRVNEVPILTATHLIFVREHNRIARNLTVLNPHWDDEKLFQESRKILGAILQHITYNEYLPRIIDKKSRRKHKIMLATAGFSSVYNDIINPSIKNVFAVAAMRFGHSQITPNIGAMKDDTTFETSKTELNFFNPEMIYRDKGSKVSNLLKWVISNSSMDVDRFFEDAIRNKLFQDKNGHSLDLTALNIQRGRDHAIPPYVEWRRFCNLSPVQEFEDLLDHTIDDIQRLKIVYRDVRDIDLYVGAMTETKHRDAVVGPTFGCILSQQFRDLKRGDRFWYEYEGLQGFKLDQLQEIRRVKLSKVMCHNFNLEYTQPDVFRLQGTGNNVIECSDLQDMDLTKWRE